MSNDEHVRTIDISVIITAHAEGILLHRTLASVRRALTLTSKHGYHHEIIIHCDNPTKATLDYIEVHKESLKDTTIFTNTFGDLASSRNFAVTQASGTYVSFIDADDLMSENWLLGALQLLQKQAEPTIAHSEVTVEFEGADSLVIKHGELGLATDALLSVYANRWNSVIVAPRNLLLEEPYAPNSPGYGYEDWHLNCRLIARGVHNLLVPETAIFVRRKVTNSEWLRQIQSMAVLRANPLLSFKFIRALDNPFRNQLPSPATPIKSSRNMKQLVKKALKKYPLAHKAATHAYASLKRQKMAITEPHRVPAWLQSEWHDMHTIDRQIYPTNNLMKTISVYDTITPEHKIAGALYKTIADSLRFDSYDYLIFVPWLLRGGADKYAINYANTITQLSPGKKVLVVTTLPVESTWSQQLDESVDFLEFGLITREASPEIKHRLLGHIIENGTIPVIHVINSEFGYEFVRLHEKYIMANGRKVVVTSFSQSVDEGGRLYGYSHTHAPTVYDSTKIYTVDNEPVKQMWVDEYGFDASKIQVHHLPVELPEKIWHGRAKPENYRILWASRLSPEKQPELIVEIANQLKDLPITIDMYGERDQNFDQAKFIASLPGNVHYIRPFNGFNDLPYTEYDLFLYTSIFDGMPNIILESAAAGLPIVSAKVGGVPYLLEDGKDALLVNELDNASMYAEGIRQLITDDQLRLRLGTQARLAVEKKHSRTQFETSVKKFLDSLN